MLRFREVWARRGIRAKSLLAAIAVMTLGLSIGGSALVIILEDSLTRTATTNSKQRALDIAAQVTSGGLKAAEPILNTTPGDGVLVQVTNSVGSVLLTSAAIAGETSLIDFKQVNISPLLGSTIVAIDSIRYVVSINQVVGTDEAAWVIVAQSLGPIDATVSTVRLIVLIAAPLLVLSVALVAWKASGQALKSVAAIRSQVDSIGHSKLSERVPVPMGQDEISDLAKTMNSMLDRLEVSVDAQKRFVADVSHELRSPLASIKTTLDVANRIGTNSEWAKAYEILNDETSRMSLLVDDLLLLAKADAGQLNLQLKEIDLDDVVTRELINFKATSTLKLDQAIQPVKILGDDLKVSQALRNILDNAKRFAKQQVWISLNVAGDHVEVTIEDDGPGIALENRVKAMERFVRLDQHRSRDDGGTGLGLAIAAEIMASHNGSLKLNNSVHGGLCATLTLPKLFTL
jgi:signal transduction histidine kinase